MLDRAVMPDVRADEALARFILFSSHIRNDKSIKADAFVPHPHRDLSVTRHRDATVDEIWSAGDTVAAIRQKILHGRADVFAAVCFAQKLNVLPDPLSDNPNHANISAWPQDKPAQKLIALELAAASSFRPRNVDDAILG